MEKPALVVMAAGMGSRFGGLKQITPVDEANHPIIDFSLYDAHRAGFRDVVFVIKEAFFEDFKKTIGNRMEKFFNVKYVFQDINRLPEGFSVPEGREKPWGTGHAIACCKGELDGPFAVINADDFYGPTAYSTIYDFLAGNTDEDQYAMVGYYLRNTVTENGSVARGVCTVEDGNLAEVTERTKIYKHGDDAVFTEDDGKTFTDLSGDTIVSMNLWGFTNKILDVLWERFPVFLEKNLPVNPLKCEYFLPFVVNEQLVDHSAGVKVLPCSETWYGVTYREDLESVVNAIRNMKKMDIYKEDLWG